MSTTPSQDHGAKPAPSRSSRIFRRFFRCFRITVLSLLLLVVVAGFYLNKAGLPEFVKKRIVAQLHAKGWDIEFSRLRLRWYRGIVAEDLHLRRTNAFNSPHIFVAEAECHLNHAAYKRLEWEIDAVVLKGGRILWMLSDTNQSHASFQMDAVAGELRFRPNDEWELRSLNARLLGTQVQLSGTLTNASWIRDWKFPKRTPQAPEKAESKWHKIVTTLDKLQLTGSPRLVGHFQGDAREFKNFTADLNYTVPALKSPWGSGTNILLTARLFPSTNSNDWVQADLKLTAKEASLPWGETTARSLQLQVKAEPPYDPPLLTRAQVVLDLRAAESRWGKAVRLITSARLGPCATNVALAQADIVTTIQKFESAWGEAANGQIALTAVHSPTNLLPALVSGKAEVDQAKSPQGSVELAKVNFSGSVPATNQLSLFQTNLTWPRRLANLPFETQATLKNVRSPKVQVEDASLTVQWESPQLRVAATNHLYQGELILKAALDAISREVIFESTSSLDAEKISPLLTPNARKWLSSYRWQEPPRVQAQGRVVLPDWDNRQPDWGHEVLPTFSVQGRFEVGAGAYRGVTFTSAQSPFGFTNMIWNIPQLKVTRPEGSLEAEYFSDQRTRDFHWQLRSSIDVKAIQPMFDNENQRRVFEFFKFETPPSIQAEVWGRWGDLQRLGGVARVAATNCTVRGEQIRIFSTLVSYTNELLTLIGPQVTHATGGGTASGMAIDFVTQKLHITNATGNLDPHVITRAISQHTDQAIAPYVFDTPPMMRASGSVDLKRGRREEDLHFEVNGGPFHWKRFHLQRVSGNIDWVGDRLSLTNMTGDFGGNGHGAGAAQFNFAQGDGADFAFRATVAETDLRTLTGDFGGKTNRLEGTLNGEVLVTQGNTENPATWQGLGSLQLRDGLIWDIPVFGVFSPVLNAILPGLGNSRAKEATATFVITNGTVSTKDLEVRATAMRMHFEGTIFFRNHLDGRMEAELLRDMPGVGFLLSKLLWPVTKIFEYKITGTLHQPKTEPVYIIPKILLFPFHPIKSLKEILPEDPKLPPDDKKP